MSRTKGIRPMNGRELKAVQDEIVKLAKQKGTGTASTRPASAARPGGAKRGTGAKRDAERFSSSLRATYHRNRTQVRPHLVAAGVLTTGLLAHACHEAGIPGVPMVVTGLCLLAPPAWYAVAGRKRIARQRRGWLTVCWVSATCWVAVASVWLSWTVLACWVLAHVALSARWWREHRDGYPSIKAPAPTSEEKPPADGIPGLWAANVGGQGAPLDGSHLTLEQVTDRTEVYTVQLKPGRQTLATAMGALDKIASGLRRPMRNLVLEEIPETGDTDDDVDPSRLRLTVVTKSPIKGKLIMTETNYRASGAAQEVA